MKWQTFLALMDAKVRLEAERKGLSLEDIRVFDISIVTPSTIASVDVDIDEDNDLVIK